MCKGRRIIFQAVIALYTAVNIMLLSLIHGTSDLRASYQENYMREFQWWNLLILVGVFALMMGLQGLWSRYFGRWQQKFWGISDKVVFTKGTLDKHGYLKLWAVMMCIWFGFFLVFYPGTVMNDTIYMLYKPSQMSNLHPVLYILYTYGLIQLGERLGNPNFGLALISLVQMVALSAVIIKAIMILYKKSKCEWLCWLLTLYFSVAPLFSTYAFSAIKDTPFSICLFWLILLLYEMPDEGEAKRRSYWVKLFLALCGIISFRSNGLLLVCATMVIIMICHRCYWKKLLLVTLTACVGISVLSTALTPQKVEPWFQESVGMQLQQVGAVVARGRELTDEQAEYLYTLLPEETWQEYAPCCSDTLKWHSDFNTEFLNETKQEFITVWLELLPGNIDVYAEAWVMNSYGFWGIETRNREQYYIKDIFENSLGLSQESPLPKLLRNLVYKYYCNRFTYRYLSAGTAFWVLFMLTVWLVYHRRYRMAVVTVPVWWCWIGLLVATPIAFTFRYVFVIALLFPFMLCAPLVLRGKNESNLQENHE